MTNCTKTAKLIQLFDFDVKFSMYCLGGGGYSNVEFDVLHFQ